MIEKVKKTPANICFVGLKKHLVVVATDSISKRPRVLSQGDPIRQKYLELLHDSLNEPQKQEVDLSDVDVSKLSFEIEERNISPSLFFIHILKNISFTHQLFFLGLLQLQTFTIQMEGV